MIMTRIQAQIILKIFINLSINQQVQMDSPDVNYVLIPYEGTIITEDPQGTKLYL